MSEDYCSFEVAKLLKEKGFDEPCRAYWDDQPVLNSRTLFWTVEPHKHCGREVSAPTHQMAMKWLREVHKLHIGIARGPKGYHITIETIPLGVVKYITREIVGTTYVDSYEEAVEAAIKYVLENLI